MNHDRLMNHLLGWYQRLVRSISLPADGMTDRQSADTQAHRQRARQTGRQTHLKGQLFATEHSKERHQLGQRTILNQNRQNKDRQIAEDIHQTDRHKGKHVYSYICIQSRHKLTLYCILTYIKRLQWGEPFRGVSKRARPRENKPKRGGAIQTGKQTYRQANTTQIDRQRSIQTYRQADQTDRELKGKSWRRLIPGRGTN